MEREPSRMFARAARVRRARARCCPRSTRCSACAQPPAHHPEVDTGVHVLPRARLGGGARSCTLPARYAVLAHDLGKAASPARRAAARTSRTSSAACALAAALSARLRVPADCRDVARARRALARRRASRARAAAGEAARRRDGGRRAAPARAPRRPDRGVRGGRAARAPGAATTIAQGERLRAALRGGARGGCGSGRACRRSHAHAAARDAAERRPRPRGAPTRASPRRSARRAWRHCATGSGRSSTPQPAAAPVRCGRRPPASRRRAGASRSARETAAQRRRRRSAIAPWRASSSRIGSTIARLFASAAGSASMCTVRCSSTWRSVSTTKPRFARSPTSPAARPMANAPAYHSGIEQRRPAPSSARRACVHARWSSSSRAAAAKRALHRRVARGQRLRRVERLRAHLAGVVHAHQAGGVARAPRRRAGLGQLGARLRARAGGDAGERAQRTVEADDQANRCTHAHCRHETKRAPEGARSVGIPASRDVEVVLRRSGSCRTRGHRACRCRRIGVDRSASTGTRRVDRVAVDVERVRGVAVVLELDVAGVRRACASTAGTCS